MLDDPADEPDIRVWVTCSAQVVPVELGVTDQIEATSTGGIAFSTIEISHSADVSQFDLAARPARREGAA